MIFNGMDVFSCLSLPFHVFSWVTVVSNSPTPLVTLLDSELESTALAGTNQQIHRWTLCIPRNVSTCDCFHTCCRNISIVGGWMCFALHSVSLSVLRLIYCMCTRRKKQDILFWIQYLSNILHVCVFKYPADHVLTDNTHTWALVCLWGKDVFFPPSSEELWIIACFPSACSSSAPNPTPHWQRQTFLLICWMLPLISHPTGKLKQHRKAYCSPAPCFSSLSSLHCCPWQPWSNSDLWHMHHFYATVSSLCDSVCCWL